MPIANRIVLFALLLLIACESSGVDGGRTQQVGERLPPVTLPPELDRVLRDYENAWRAGDAAALSVLFADDGLVLPLGALPVRGHAAIQQSYGTPSGDLNLAPIAYAASDSVGYIIGTFGGADISSHTSKFILTLKRSGSGRWLIAADMGQP